MRGDVTRWAGGYVRKGIYIIRRSVRGREYEYSTRATTEAAALQQLARFEADPADYTPSPPAPEPILLGRELAKEFLTWSREEKGNTRDWVRKQQLALAWWGDELAGVDLRRASLVVDVMPRLKGKGWRQRARVLKALYGWLRQDKHVIGLADDPLHGQLRIPGSKPQQWKVPKKIPRKDYRKALPFLEQPYRAAVEVLDGTGWHVEEVVRFAGAGAVHQVRIAGRQAWVLDCPQTKGGSAVRRSVSWSAAAAAKRLLKNGAGGLTYHAIRAALVEACERAGVAQIHPGRFRHTFATYAVEHGGDPEKISSALDHKSRATMQRFYSTLAIRPKVPTPR